MVLVDNAGRREWTLGDVGGWSGDILGDILGGFEGGYGDDVDDVGVWEEWEWDGGWRVKRG